MKNTITRRKFITGSAAASVLPLLSASSVRADNEQLKIEENNPQAIALGYKHQASDVDVTKFPRRAGDAGQTQFCSNCMLFNGKAENEWAPCVIFANKLVKGEGWCNAWAKKAS